MDFLISPSQLHISALAGARFSVTFDCPKVTKGHRGHFKPPPGPPGEGVTFFPSVPGDAALAKSGRARKL